MYENVFDGHFSLCTEEIYYFKNIRKINLLYDFTASK